VLPK
jgi:hypothetical protein